MPPSERSGRSDVNNAASITNTTGTGGSNNYSVVSGPSASLHPNSIIPASTNPSSNGTTTLVSHPSPDYFSTTDMDFDTAYMMMTADQPVSPLLPQFHTGLTPTASPKVQQSPQWSGEIGVTGQISVQTPPPIQGNSPAAGGSPISPTTRMLLNTFNNLNYSVASSRYAVADWNRQSMPPQSMPAQPVQIQSVSEPLVPTPSIQPHLAPTLSDPSQPPDKLPAPPPPPPPPALQNSSELLSLTETSALESFLDSIANDRSFDKLAKQWGSIDPGYGGGTKKKRKLSSSEVKIESSESPESLSAAAKRQLLTDEEKKQNHTVSEQKRRAMIRDSFRSLSDMLDSSQFEATREDKKKSRSARKAMSKYNVLNRAVVELELLRELNGKLRDLVGEIR